ncbi:unnamed protein product, partial [Symbiodinium pilosum]
LFWESSKRRSRILQAWSSAAPRAAHLARCPSRRTAVATTWTVPTVGGTSAGVV